MQLYEPTRPQPSPRHGQIPAGCGVSGLRAPLDQPAGSATPIYDSLCTEFHRMFRALPGDRTGEEELRFTGFGLLDSLGETVGGAGGWRGYTRWLDAPTTGYFGPLGHSVPAPHVGSFGAAGPVSAASHPSPGDASDHRERPDPADPFNRADRFDPFDSRDPLSQLGGTTVGRVVPAALPPARLEPVQETFGGAGEPAGGA